METLFDKTSITYISNILEQTVRNGSPSQRQATALITLALTTCTGVYASYKGIKRTYQAYKDSKEALDVFEKNQGQAINYRKLPRNIIESCIALAAAFYGTFVPLGLLNAFRSAHI